MNIIKSITTFEKHELLRQGDAHENLAVIINEEQQLDLAQDIFSSLYKSRPSLVDEEEIESFEDRRRRSVFASGLGTKEWSELRDCTIRNPTMSAMAVPKLKEDLDKEIEKDEEYQQQKQQLQEYEDLLNDMRNEDGSPPNIPDSWKEYERELRESMSQSERQFMRRAARTTEAKVSEMQEAMAAWGLDDGPNEGMNMTPEELREVTNLVMKSSKLREIAKMAGRMERIALRTHERRSEHRRETICDVEPSDDIAHLIPTELTSLAVPELQPLFIRRFIEKRLMCYKLSGLEPLGRGPIIMAYDSSGSMSGKREIFAKALVFGLLAIASKEGRDVHVFEFSSANQLETWSFPRGIKDPKKLVDMANHFFGGGTDPSNALKESIEVIDTATDNKGDIIFISDGEFCVSDSLMEHIKTKKEEREFRMVTIGIGGCNIRALEDVADDQLTIVNLMDDTDVTDAVFSI